MRNSLAIDLTDNHRVIRMPIGTLPQVRRSHEKQEGSPSMETQQLHRGRLIDHLHLVVADLDASRRFYEAVLEVLRIPIGGNDKTYFWADELFVSSADSEAALGKLTGRHHLAFQAEDRAMVDAFHMAALAAGGTDNGAPGERPYHPGYYAAFVIDPDGNNIEAVFHGDAKRSAASVEIIFDE
jgi:catechol 2,3-dioxygenase-like lactoylglutathione lyase family enzyme